MPKYQTSGASGFDLHSTEDLVLKPGEKILVPTGLAFNIPLGHELQIRPRSGLSFKTGLRVINSPGTIDSDYTGELKIIMQNTGSLFEIINEGDRVAQAVLVPIIQAELIETTELNKTERSNQGFGHTGKN